MTLTRTKVNVILASSIELKTGQDGGQCDAAYSLDGGDFTDGCTISDLSKDLHQVEVRPANGSDSFRFYGVSGDVQLGGKGS